MELVNISPIVEGKVYRARENSLARSVAFKKNCPPREAELTAKFLPHVFLEYNPDTQEMVMECGAYSLHQSIVDKRDINVKKLCQDVAESLSPIHRSGLVHGDIKPQNILFSHQGKWTVIDLGSCRPERDLILGLRGPGGYSAPEHCLQAPETTETDIFCLGLCLFQAYTGQKPFGNGWLEHAHGAVHNATPFLGTDPLSLIITKCLAKSPSERFSTALELLSAIRAVDAVV